MIKLPELKKKMGSFLRKEDGKISKENIIKAGLVISVIGAAVFKDATAGHCSHNDGLAAVCKPGTYTKDPDCGGASIVDGHCNNINITKDDGSVLASHQNAKGDSHVNHSNHSNCGSGSWFS